MQGVLVSVLPPLYTHTYTHTQTGSCVKICFTAYAPVITIKTLASLSKAPHQFLKDLHNWCQFHNAVLELCFLPSILKGLANVSLK